MPERPCLFASDLHGREGRYRKLFAAVEEKRPRAVFLGGDLLPSGTLLLAQSGFSQDNFLMDFFLPRLRELRAVLEDEYPRLFLILGNDDARCEEASLRQVELENLGQYIHMRKVMLGGQAVYGYACVPPTPFSLKDWERYDVSRYVDPGAVPPEEGRFSVAVPEEQRGFPTIQEDLAALAGRDSLARAIFLFHSPPYQTRLDRAALDGRQVDHVPLDLHVGSIAVRRFIEERQPLVTLHGHVHESARLTGSWQDRIGKTYCFSAAHDGAELALIIFEPADPGSAIRLLI